MKMFCSSGLLRKSWVLDLQNIPMGLIWWKSDSFLFHWGQKVEVWPFLMFSA